MRIEDLPERYRKEARRQVALSGGVAVSVADLECVVGGKSLAAKENPKVDSRCRVRVLCKRHRLADPDGISVKAVLDGLVLAGILGGDSAKEIIESPVVRQERVGKGEREETVIEILGEEEPTHGPSRRRSRSYGGQAREGRRFINIWC